MRQNEIQGVEMAVEIQLRQPLSRLRVIFCEQVLISQYFSQTKPDRRSRNLFKTDILQARSTFFLIRIWSSKGSRRLVCWLIS
jgi:hypothetical protein